MHDFDRDLRWSQEQADHPMWEAVYRKAFPTMQSMNSVNEDGWAQRGGIDRLIVLSSGRTITVDEKVRRKAYRDVALEYEHAHQGGRKTPGWIEKEAACDFLAYAWEPLGIAYLFPWLQLQRAWSEHSPDWFHCYRKVAARNRTYTTYSLAVPLPVLVPAVADAMRVEWRERRPEDMRPAQRPRDQLRLL